MDRLCTEKPFLHRRVYAIILVRPCINLYFWFKTGLVPIASSRITATGVILPAVTLAVVVGSKYYASGTTRYPLKRCKRITLSEPCAWRERNEDFIRHILPNAVLPLITILGVLIGWFIRWCGS